MPNPETRIELSERIDATWIAFLGALDAVPADAWDWPGVCGYWSVGELIAHISYWEAKVPEYISRDRLGLARVRGGIETGVDQENLEVTAASRFVANINLLRTLHLVHDQITRSIGDLSDPIASNLLEHIAGDTWDHYPEHTEQLTAWAAAQGNPGKQYAAIVAGTLALAEAIDPDLRDQPGITGEWSARDLLTHLAFWDDIRVQRLDVLAGRQAAMPNLRGDVDEINKRAMRETANQSWDTVLDGIRTRASRLAALLETESEATLSHPIVEHWLEHANELRSAVYDGVSHDH